MLLAACPPSARPLAGILEQEAPLRHPQPVAGAGAAAAACPPCLRPGGLGLGAL